VLLSKLFLHLLLLLLYPLAHGVLIYHCGAILCFSTLHAHAVALEYVASASLLACPVLVSVGDLIRSRCELESWSELQYLQRRRFMSDLGQHRLLCPFSPAVANRCKSLQGIKAAFDEVLIKVEELLPDGWFEAAQGVPIIPQQGPSPPLTLYDGSLMDVAGASSTATAIAASTSASASAAELFLYTLGWKIGRNSVTFASFKVKVGTSLQLNSRPAP